MQNYTHFIGADIGKETLAICVIDGAENRLLECSATNTRAGMQTLLGKLQRLPGFDLATTLICMEHTGVYCQPMVSFFYPLGVALWVQSAVQIKQSLGVKRGKTDKADARSIATYSLRHQKDLRLFCLTDSVLAKVRQLASQRERLMEMAKQLTDIAQDYKAMGLVEELKLHEPTSESVLLALKKQITQVDKQIDTEIKADTGLQTRVDLLTSIPGVGRQTALYMLIFTAKWERRCPHQLLKATCWRGNG